MPVIPDSLTKIQEEEAASTTRARYGAETMGFNAVTTDADGGFVADSTHIAQTYHDVVVPLGVSALAAKIDCKGLNDGDLVAIDIGPDTAVGEITQDVAAAAIEIDVPASVIALLEDDTLWPGMKLCLDDGTNKDDCAAILSYDLDTNKITVKTATVNAFLAATPTLLKVTASMSPNILNGGWYELAGGDNKLVNFGEAKIGASFIAANKVVRVRYRIAVGGVDCRPRVTLEYLY